MHQNCMLCFANHGSKFKLWHGLMHMFMIVLQFWHFKCTIKRLALKFHSSKAPFLAHFKAG